MHYVSGALKKLGIYTLPPLIFSLSMFVCTTESEYIAPRATPVVREYLSTGPTARKTPVAQPPTGPATPSTIFLSTPTPVPSQAYTPSPTPVELMSYVSIESKCNDYTPTPTSAVKTPNAATDAVSTPAAIHSSNSSIASTANYDINFPQVLSNVCGISAVLPIENPDMPEEPLKHYVRSIAVSDGPFLSGGRGLEVGWVKCNYAEEYQLPCSEPALFIARYYGGDEWGRTFYDIDMGENVEVAIANNLQENSGPYIWYALVRINDSWDVLYKDRLEFSAAPRAVEMVENYELR